MNYDEIRKAFEELDYVYGAFEFCEETNKYIYKQSTDVNSGSSEMLKDVNRAWFTFRDGRKSRDKEISESNRIRDNAIQKYSDIVDKYCNLVDQNIELKEKLKIAVDCIMETNKFMNRLPSEWYPEWLVAKQSEALSKLKD